MSYCTAAERLIIDAILEVYPEDTIIREEKDPDLEHATIGDNTYRWVIDPLDGTRNLSIGNPVFAVSIGLLKGSEIVGGVVFFPILDEYYVSIGNSSSLFGAIAGVSLVRNAGGIAVNLEGGMWKPGDVGIICGSPQLVRVVCKELGIANLQF